MVPNKQIQGFVYVFHRLLFLIISALNSYNGKNGLEMLKNFRLLFRLLIYFEQIFVFVEQSSNSINNVSKVFMCVFNTIYSLL